MKIENNTNMQPTSHNCSINIQQDKFFNKLNDELKALQTQLFEVEKKVNARDTVIDTIDLSTQSLSVGESTETKDLYVNNNASIQGELSANKATIDTLTVLNDFITQLLHVTDLFANTADIEEADIRSAIIDVLKIKQAITRFDTNQEIVSFPSENVTQIGDIANSILLAGLERPTWNGSPIALTSDLSMGLTPNYKGTVETEKELPPTAKLGDFYLINKLTRNGQTGLGGAIYGINKTWEITLYFEILNYFNKDEINQLFDEELIDDIQRETDIIKGNTPVQVVANGCVMKRDDGTSDRLATAVDAFMLSGPEGMDNIARNSSLDDLVVCGQYSADDDLANTITEKPTNEAGAFDIAVGQFSGSKQDIYQLYTGKASQKNYFRIGLNKEFNGWNEIATTESTIKKALTADNLNAKAKLDGKNIALENNVISVDGSSYYTASSGSFNDFKDGVTYVKQGDYKNMTEAPSEDDAYTVWTFTTNSIEQQTSYRKQIAYRRSSNNFYTRLKSADKWGNWQQDINRENKMRHESFKGLMRSTATTTPSAFFNALKIAGYKAGDMIYFLYSYASAGQIQASGNVTNIVGGYMILGEIKNYDYVVNSAVYIGTDGSISTFSAKYDADGKNPTAEYLKNFTTVSQTTLATYNQGITKEI